MSRSSLRFGFGSRPPDLGDIRVFDRLETTLVGEPFTFDVIGSSHYVHSASCGFHELCSCNPIDDGFRVCTLELVEGTSREIAFRTDSGMECRTSVDVRPLREMPDGTDFDLRFAFADEAYTAIRIGDARYDTYHTYPEHGLVVRTETRLLDRRSAPLDEP